MTLLLKVTTNADGYTGDRLGLSRLGFKSISNWTGVTLDSTPTEAFPAKARAR